MNHFVELSLFGVHFKFKEIADTFFLLFKTEKGGLHELAFVRIIPRHTGVMGMTIHIISIF